MQRIEYRDVVDKAEWPRGEWDNEPDKIQWQDKDTGLPCLIVRNQFGSLCGYVGVAKGHSLHGEKYQDHCDFDVHGGLSYSDGCQPEDEPSEGICHIPGDGEPDHVWWFGFHCGHVFDVAPGMQRYAPSLYETNDGLPKCVYRNVEYVAGECRSLAKQLHEAANGNG